VTSEGVSGSLGTGTGKLWLGTIGRHLPNDYVIVTKLLKDKNHDL